MFCIYKIYNLKESHHKDFFVMAFIQLFLKSFICFPEQQKALLIQ